MDREYNVMKALSDAGSVVPVTRPVAVCTDASYIGAPFYLMSLVDGVAVQIESAMSASSRASARSSCIWRQYWRQQDSHGASPPSEL